MIHQYQRSAGRAAFTLLELVLTVSMSVVLMGLIGAAIQFYARHGRQRHGHSANTVGSRDHADDRR